MIHRKRKRVALTQFESAEALRLAWRQLVPHAQMPARDPRRVQAAVAGTIWPVLSQPEPSAVPAYAEELRGFVAPDWSNVIVPYPCDADEQPATAWGGVSTVHAGRWAQ